VTDGFMGKLSFKDYW